MKKGADSTGKVI